MKWRKDID